jgi:hypothetical protein
MKTFRRALLTLFLNVTAVFWYVYRPKLAYPGVTPCLVPGSLECWAARGVRVDP